MNVSRDGALITMIQIDIAGCGNQQFVHGAVDEFPAENMPKRVQDSCDFNRDGEDHGLVQTLVESKLRVEQVQDEVKAEENKWTEPCKWCY